MASNWALPNTIIQYAESGFENIHVAWDNSRQFSPLKNKDGIHTKTVRDLIHIARDPKHDIVEKTYFLKLTGFNFTNIPIFLSGIEVKVTMNRYGRITDDEINLCLNNETIGTNQADRELSPIKIYGGQSYLWETGLTIADLSNSSFGCVFRFQSHPNWPHKCSALIDAVEIRVH